MHLSQTNNRPEIALEVARDALGGRQVRLLAASQEGSLSIQTDAPPPSERLEPPARPVVLAPPRRNEQLRLPF